MTTEACADEQSGIGPASRGCPVCGSSDEVDFFEIERLPVHVCMLGRSRQAALDAPTGSITLSYCTGCGLIRNRRFEPRLVSFEPGYEASLRHSETFRTFMEQLADASSTCTTSMPEPSSRSDVGPDTSSTWSAAEAATGASASTPRSPPSANSRWARDTPAWFAITTANDSPTFARIFWPACRSSRTYRTPWHSCAS